MKPPAQPPQRVPVLTEVVVLPSATPEVVVDDYPPIPPDPSYAETAPAPFDGLDLAIPRQPPPGVLGATPAATPATTPAAVAPAAVPSPPALDEARVVQRVMADLDKQLDLMFEQRLREALTPVLTRMTDSLVREMRGQLAQHLREMVTKAVSLELDRHLKR